jgi:hypothetical protein
MVSNLITLETNKILIQNICMSGNTYVWVVILICNATPRWSHSLIDLMLACTCKKATFHHYFSFQSSVVSQLSFQSSIVCQLRADLCFFPYFFCCFCQIRSPLIFNVVLLPTLTLWEWIMQESFCYMFNVSSLSSNLDIIQTYELYSSHLHANQVQNLTES